MEAEKCNLPHDAHFHRRRHLVHVWRVSVACGCMFFTCGESALHAEAVCWHAETHLCMRRYILDVWRDWAAPHTLQRHSSCLQAGQKQQDCIKELHLVASYLAVAYPGGGICSSLSTRFRGIVYY